MCQPVGWMTLFSSTIAIAERWTDRAAQASVVHPTKGSYRLAAVIPMLAANHGTAMPRNL
ncbi:hypothetical protein DNK44_16035 [Pseudomonas dryadis]|uniref:Uncharacterized protein n=1 Tax=Phytopseudomonas dryadis TaxID=2487520 RepID=A0A4Q9QZG5_9GAMM|nr:hypothetical protein DNK44_16035 [Pseudomonas dryadis]